mmetsp:Transcript_85051/g.240849  ORF Transcript_85051/g.240849 Transcript_85051/m.240849 type:complete len:270 (-) Transcript_85051:1204-2013(-)
MGEENDGVVSLELHKVVLGVEELELATVAQDLVADEHLHIHELLCADKDHRVHQLARALHRLLYRLLDPLGALLLEQRAPLDLLHPPILQGAGGVQEAEAQVAGLCEQRAAAATALGVGRDRVVDLHVTQQEHVVPGLPKRHRHLPRQYNEEHDGADHDGQPQVDELDVDLLDAARDGLGVHQVHEQQAQALGEWVGDRLGHHCILPNVLQHLDLAPVAVELAVVAGGAVTLHKDLGHRLDGLHHRPFLVALDQPDGVLLQVLDALALQ